MQDVYFFGRAYPFEAHSLHGSIRGNGENSVLLRGEKSHYMAHLYGKNYFSGLYLYWGVITMCYFFAYVAENFPVTFLVVVDLWSYGLRCIYQCVVFVADVGN